MYSPFDYPISKCKKQVAHIDIVCQVNNEFLIVIEDKVNASQGKGQLSKYKAIVLKYFDTKTPVDKNKILYIYFKTGEQSDISEVHKQKYLYFSRQDFLLVLGRYSGSNSILVDYREHLQMKSDDICAYLTQPIKEWKRDQWIGFYQELQKTFQGQWKRVNNPDGGFMGYHFCWCEISHPKVRIYLQLEQQKLCFKIKNTDQTFLQSEILYEHLVEVGQSQGIQIKRPKRMRVKGKTITVAFIDDYLSDLNSQLDLYATKENINLAIGVLEKVLSNWNVSMTTV